MSLLGWRRGAEESNPRGLARLGPRTDRPRRSTEQANKLASPHLRPQDWRHAIVSTHAGGSEGS